MIRKIFFVLITISIFLGTLSGCQDKTGFLGTDVEVETELITLSEVSIPIEKPRTLNPVISKDEDWYYLNKLIYEQLFELDETFAPVGVLAKDYKYNEEGDSVTIFLQSGVLWHDGKPFSANDVKFSIDVYTSLKKTDLSLYSSYVSNIKSTKVIDDTTIQIDFSKDDDVAIENLIFPIIPKHTFDRASSVKNIIEGFVPIGTGPYKVDSIDVSKNIVLIGNENYKGDTPGNTLNVKILPGEEEAINLFKTRETNMTFLKDIGRNTLLNDKEVNIKSFTSNEVEVLGFNFTHGALQDVNVRQAIAYAINNDRIIESCYYNNAIFNDSIYFPNYLGIESNTNPYSYNADRARQLLKEADYEGLSLTLLVNGDNHARNLAAQNIEKNLEEIGISVSLLSLNWEDYNTALNKGDYDIFIGGYHIKNNYDTRSILHSKYDNLISYSNIELDNLLDRMQSAININEKKQVFSNINDILIDEIPYYTLLFKTYSVVTSPELKGEVTPYYNNIYNGCKSWSIVYEKVVEN